MKFKSWLIIVIICIGSIYGYSQYSNGKTEAVDLQQVEDVSSVLNESVSITLEMKCLLDAICQVESNCESDVIGDFGDSIGAYQIQYAYWFDAVEWDPSLSFWFTIFSRIYLFKSSHVFFILFFYKNNNFSNPCYCL